MLNKIYKPLGLKRTLYNPRNIIPLNEIVPSEEDVYYRHNTLRGFVHDMGAAMQGGIGGHAGLFSNATEVGKIMQLYLIIIILIKSLMKLLFVKLKLQDRLVLLLIKFLSKIKFVLNLKKY